MLYILFWVIPQRRNFICQRFGTLYLFHLHRRVDIKNDGLRMLVYLYGKRFGSKIACAEWHNVAKLRLGHVGGR